MDVKYVDTLLLDNEEGCTWRQIPIKFIHLNILEESFCMFHEYIKNYLAHLNSSVSLKPCLIEKFCTHGWTHRKKYCYVHLFKVRGTKKKLNLVDQCYPYRIIWFLWFIHPLECWKKNTTLWKMNVSILNWTAHRHIRFGSQVWTN